MTMKDKSVDGVLGIQTRGSRLVDIDASTELERCTYDHIFFMVVVGPPKVGMLRPA